MVVTFSAPIRLLIKGGDKVEKDILEQLYRKYTRQVYLYLYSLCHNHDLAEDLMQETFLKAFCTVEKAGGEMLPWLLVVARNLYLDIWRKEKRITRWEDADISDEGEAILEQMIKKEQNQRLYRAILRLKDTEREAVELYYFAGLSQETISGILNLSYSNTRVTLYRAKQKLKRMLDENRM